MNNIKIEIISLYFYFCRVLNQKKKFNILNLIKINKNYKYFPYFEQSFQNYKSLIFFNLSSSKILDLNHVKKISYISNIFHKNINITK